jgi:hypothetical protein
LTLIHFNDSLGPSGKFTLNDEFYNAMVMNSLNNDELQPLSVICFVGPKNAENYQMISKLFEQVKFEDCEQS